MKRHTRRLLIVAAGAAIAIIAVVVPAVDVGAAAPACTAASGVTVIVDFTYFSGGRVERGCAAGHPVNALAALHAAGFATAGTAQYGDAFVCRIDGLPTPQHEACAVTPSPTSYWAFWNARPSDSNWTYSNIGVLDFRPAAGSIEAFAFGSHALPSIAPSAALPPTTTPATRPPTTRPATTKPAPTTTTTPVAVATLAPTTSLATTPAPAPAPTPQSTSTTTSTSASTPASTSTSTTRGPATTRDTPHVIDRSAAGPRPHSSSGTPLAAIVAIVVVGCLAAGAFAFARARRLRTT